MEILIGKTAGFCYGVKRAVNGANDEIKNDKENVYCLGEIVHNKQVINDLKEKGLTFIDDIDEAISGKIIIRAHGVKKEMYDGIRKRKLELKDYTCPNVLKIHKIANEYAEKGYFILLCGSKSHPENIGTISYCGKNSYIIDDENEILNAMEVFEKSGIDRLLLISQTTYSMKKFCAIEEIIKKKLPQNKELLVKNTICKATELRQNETEELAKKVEYMIIIGGENSSNTRKLYEIAKANCKNCVCVETAGQLDLEKIQQQATIGIMAGASTPKESIEEIVKRID